MTEEIILGDYKLMLLPIYTATNRVYLHNERVRLVNFVNGMSLWGIWADD